MGQRRRPTQPQADPASGGEPASPAPRRARDGIWSVIREVLSVAAIALVISFLIKTFLAQAFWIPSGSMENTLVYGDRVIVSKVQSGPLAIDRGDIVVFEDPGDWLPPVTPPDRGPVLNPVVDALEFVGLAPTTEGNHLIKRVIGLPGDRVRCCDGEGRVTVNGQALDEDYLFPGDEPSESAFDVTVPEGRVWVMGDHRSISGDSRAHDDGSGANGSIPQDRIVGQAMALVWPLSRLDWFQTPATLSEVPSAAPVRQS
ncbi:MAG TPA: signal peptidase I [Ornithinimicrobium sp.]|uniref:signal peptidase I n=1 Tax=Ornithinimicrobium sp. TaxID=1977084 RepID=UPI002B49B757|nr:signal peptidase I [Ornithinimicrobium sp.]HKJ11819.1 signal peptidase I [Ornithinimicrobium sp.]